MGRYSTGKKLIFINLSLASRDHSETIPELLINVRKKTTENVWKLRKKVCYFDVETAKIQK